MPLLSRATPRRFDLDTSGTQDLVHQIRLAQARYGLEGHGGRDCPKLVARFALEDRTFELFFAHQIPLWDLLLLEVVCWGGPRAFRDSAIWRFDCSPIGHDVPPERSPGPVGSCKRPEPAIRRWFLTGTSRLRRIAQPNQWVPTAAIAFAREEARYKQQQGRTSAIPAAPFGSPANRGELASAMTNQGNRILAGH